MSVSGCQISLEYDESSNSVSNKHIERNGDESGNNIKIVPEENEIVLRRNAKNEDQMMTLKTTLKINLVTIVLLLFLLPRHCLAIYHYQCYLIQGGCSNYLLLFNRVAALQICVTVILPLLVARTTDKIV